MDGNTPMLPFHRYLFGNKKKVAHWQPLYTQYNLQGFNTTVQHWNSHCACRISMRL